MSEPKRGTISRSPVSAHSGGHVQSHAHDRLLDVQETARLLGVKPATLYQWAYKRRIPVVKLFGPHGALRFRLSDVEKLIQDSLRPASGSGPRTDGSPGPRG